MTALILVDLQNDFMPGGALEVKEGDEVLTSIRELMKMPFDAILATRDWHPVNHGSFASVHQLPVGTVVELEGIPQILWPNHCVQGTHGALFHSGWDSSKVNEIFLKGIDPKVDSYSTFFDNGHKRNTGLKNYLDQHQIKTVYIAGLATDYCVKYSVLDACHLGLKTHVVIEGCRGVNLNADDSKKAFEEMKLAGAHLIHLSDIRL